MAWSWAGAAAQLAKVGLPILGTALAGPAGTVAGGAISSIVSSLLGVDEKEITPDNLVSWSQNPEMVVKLKEIESNRELKLAEIHAEAVRAEYQDIADARAMHVATTQATGKRDVNLYVLAWVVVIGMFTLIGILIFQPLPLDSNGVIFMLFGTLATGFGQVLQFFFGSSRGSQEKTALLAQQKT